MSYSYSSEKAKSMQPLGESHSHSLGRFGTGYVDLVTGNLIIQSEDFAWSGRKMPVTIRHAYNSALKDTHFTYNEDYLLNMGDFSQYTLGKGFHLNFWQCIKWIASYPMQYAYYDENGQMIRLTMNDPSVDLYQDSDKTMSLRMQNCELERSGEFYRFNPTSLRLEEIYRYVDCSDGTKTKLSTLITYDASGNTVTIKDGAGRNFTLSFSNSRLIKMTAPDNSQITYAYNTSGYLTRVNYPDNRYVRLGYSGSALSEVVLGTVTNNTASDHYKVTYAYTANKVTAITEYAMGDNGWEAGQSTTYTYDEDARTTSVVNSEESDEFNGTQELTTTYCFDVEGTLINQYLHKSGDSTEIVIPSGAGSGINPYLGDGGVSVTETVINLLEDHDFRSLDHWTPVIGIECSGDPRATGPERYSKYGQHSVRLTTASPTGSGTGMYQTVTLAERGEYTFSAYANIPRKAYGENHPGVYLRVTDASERVLYESEHVKETGGEPFRLVAPFYLQAAGTVKLYVLIDGLATVFVSAAQLEACAYANKYNMLYNSSFEKAFITNSAQSGWDKYQVSFSTEEKLNGTRSVKAVGDGTHERFVNQFITPKTKKSTRETYTLMGWAKVHEISYTHYSNEENDPQRFQLRAEIHYTDGTYEDHIAKFNPYNKNWQPVSLEFSKGAYKEIDFINIFCEFSFITGTVYFDDVQLLCESCETDLSSSDFSDNNVEENGSDNADEDAIAETDAEEGFIETTDSYGNPLSETTFHDGEFGSMYRFFKYGGGGNDLREETDNRGNTTQYTVDDATSQNKEIVDRCGNKTCYEYDDSGRTTCVRQKDKNNTELANVSYSYDAFDQLTAIARGDGMTFNLAYNNFHKLEGIYAPDGVYSVKYGYKNNNGRLKTVTYSNGWTMTATYNAYGQMMAEKWTHRAKDPIEYKYVYDSEGNIVRSIDKSSNKEYNYYYEDGRVVRSAEFDVTFDSTGNYVTSKAFCVQVAYLYNADGEMTKKIIRDASGDEQIYKYTNPEGSNPVVTLPTGVVSQSKNDKFGRKEFDELQLGRDFMYRRFTYHDGSITGRNRLSENLKSTPTTNLVKEITLEDGRTLEYEYDEEERIIKVTDTVDGVAEYTYDAQGQLTEERVTPVGSMQATRTMVMTYDNYGNILSKTTNGTTKTYEYNCTWKDKLTAVNGVPIVYDNLGNPISYLGSSLSWEKGRQLKKFTKADGTIISYTYNANGIRTSKTVDGVLHTYQLDGTKILKETWGDCTLIPLYDNGDSVCGIIYDDAAYYFHKNLQGDVIGIKNAYGVLVARYTYDAWGKVISITNENGLDVTDNAAHVANANPFRYRGYYYDVEIGMYYLQSRYYDPAVGRFINGDDPSIIDNSSNSVSIATNKFCYCFNSPINDADDCGSIAGTIVKMIGNFFWGMFAGMLGLYLANVTLNIANGKKDFYAKNDTWGTYIAEGVKSGAFSIFGSKLVYKIIAVIGASVLKQIIDMIIYKTSFNFWGLLIDILIGIAFVLVIHFGPTIIGKLSKKQKKSKYKWIEMLKELIKKIADFIINKLKNVINNLINFFKNTFAKRFSISYAKKIAPELLTIFFN